MENQLSHLRIPSTRHFVLIVVSASLAVWYMHFREIDIPRQAERRELHARIVSRVASSPYRYRVLLPYSAETMARALAGAVGYRGALLASYGILEALSLLLLSLALYYYLGCFFPPLPSLLGVLLAHISMVVALRDHYFQPWSLANGAFFALAALFLCRRRLALFAFVVLLSAFNRETSLVLPFMYLFVFMKKGRFRKVALGSLLLLVLWIGAYLFVRNLQGQATHLYTLSEILAKNLRPKYLVYLFLNLSLFLGVLWFYAAAGFGKAPVFVRRLSLVLPLYLVPVILFGVWKEVRLLIPLYPVLLPLALSFLFPPREA